MWDGAITAAVTRPARLTGFTRRYCLWDEQERGTPAHRSLTLGLEPGGACDGLAMRVAGLGWQMRMKKAWAHEMVAGFYEAMWVPVTTADGTVTALTFVADPAHPLFAGTVADTAPLLASTRGLGGTAAEYLARTADTLHRLGTPDPYLDGLRLHHGPTNRQ